MSDLHDEDTPGEALRLPRLGERVLVPAFLRLADAADNFYGGLCTVSRIIRNAGLPTDHVNYCMIEIEEDPGSQYNWHNLLEGQAEWMSRYGHTSGGVEPKDPDQ